MSDECNSPATNENLSAAESKDKREAEFGDSGSVTKKRRTDDDSFDNQKDQGSEDSKEGTERNSPLHGSSDRKEENASGNQEDFEIEAEAAEDKGSRHTMEDAWVVLPDASLNFRGKLRCAHYAIYDGHGGRLAAEYAQKHLHKNVLSAGLPPVGDPLGGCRVTPYGYSVMLKKVLCAFPDLDPLTEQFLSSSCILCLRPSWENNAPGFPVKTKELDVKAAKRAILDGFRQTDETLILESATGGWQDGATAVCVWVLGQTVFVANIGDAKAVVARSSAADGFKSTLEGVTPMKAIVLTREHKAIYPQERARIQKAGGSVSSNGRLLGRLEVSRAFGDRQFKRVGVIATPDIHSFGLTERDHFIILGCDGLWGVFGPLDAVEYVHKLLKEGLSVASVSRSLVREAVRERLCKDNCTAMVIAFKHK